jgi:Flp pilus assembly protein TadG
MTPHLRFARQLAASTTGSAVVEFAMIAPIMIMMVIGGIYMSMLGYTANSLHFAVEAAARCASVNTTVCTNATTTQAFASSRFVNLGGDPVTFTYTTPTCGKQVEAAMVFVLNTGISQYRVPLNATACFPT